MVKSLGINRSLWTGVFEGYSKVRGWALVGVQWAEPPEASVILHFLNPENGLGLCSSLSVLQ